jgi:ATP-dependent Lon protease
LKSEGKNYPRRIVPATVERFLGPPEYFQTEAERQDEIGVATGLAWTEMGGDIMAIEVVVLEGKGNLQITGQIGDIMQESAQAGLSYLKSHCREFDLDPNLFEGLDIHIHVPEGAVPKDGPSAGISITTALISAFTERMVRKEVGMTGEITLRGRVLPIGGLREKILAAHRSGLTTVIMPERNQKDLVDVPKKVLSDVKIITVTHMDQVLKVALHGPETRPPISRFKLREPEEEQD